MSILLCMKTDILGTSRHFQTCPNTVYTAQACLFQYLGLLWYFFLNSRFKDSNVQVVSGYPQDKLNDLKLKIYVDLPTALNATGTPACVLGASTLRGNMCVFSLPSLSNVLPSLS